LGAGTVFAINTDGTGFTTLHSFNDYEGAANPWAPLILSRNTLYGTTYNSWSLGTVFALNTDGTGFTVVHEFNGDDGIRPMAGLILSGDTLYGTTSGGGSSNAGVVFKVHIDGTGFYEPPRFQQQRWK